MKRTKLLFLSSLTILTMGLVATSAVVAKENINIVRVEGYTNNDAATYYSSISSSLTGSSLLSSLQSLNKTKRQSLVGYGSMPSKFAITDPGTSGNQVTSFYSGKSANYSGNMNREHVWPASRTVGGRGSDPLEDDIHMVRPTLTSENSDRGNSFFAESGAWDPNSFGVDSYRGDSARIIFYCVVADSRLSLVDKSTDYSSNHTMGKLSDLLKWNLKYPVLQREKTRNEQAEYYQGNRNPFIDHPEYACKIWGSYNEACRQACSGAVTPSDDVKTISLNVSEYSIDVGSTYQLIATVTPSSAQNSSLIWGSSNESVAKVDDNGLVTGIGNGKASINVSNSTGTAFASCVFTVGTGEAPAPAPRGCGGNIYTTSIIISTISLIGVSLVLLKKIKTK